jgi:hypothetical protein
LRPKAVRAWVMGGAVVGVGGRLLAVGQARCCRTF